jgi:uncharacterized protein
MLHIGKYNKLKVLRKVDFGFYLDGLDAGEILLPLRYAPQGCKPGDTFEVFIYLDSEDRLIATTEKPFAIVGEFAYLRVVTVDAIGAFLDWGLPKDLLVPFREQKVRMEVGKSYVVFIYVDGETDRIAASAKVDQFLNHEPINYLPGDEVDLFVIGESPLGFKTAINSRHEGIIYKNEIFKPLTKGIQLKGYIKKIRPDGKIDLSLYKIGSTHIDDYAEALFKIIEENNGTLNLSDSSPAEQIYEQLGISKKLFKKAVGTLFRKGVIQIGEDSIWLC